MTAVLTATGWCANTSCRRVLVTHADGSQTVEEIKNDLGISANDKEAMMANLQAQVRAFIESAKRAWCSYFLEIRELPMLLVSTLKGLLIILLLLSPKLLLPLLIRRRLLVPQSLPRHTSESKEGNRLLFSDKRDVFYAASSVPFLRGRKFTKMEGQVCTVRKRVGLYL